MGYPLAPHLRHAAGSAWLDPISLVAQLPASLSISSPQEKLAYMHEYVHYIQAVTTFYGANRLHCFLKSLRRLQGLLKASGGDVDALDRALFATSFKANTADLTFVTSDAPDQTNGIFLRVPTRLDGLWMLGKANERVLGFCRPLSAEMSSVFSVGAIAIQESQAMAVERWFDMEASAGLYHQAASAENNAFQYAVITESLKKIFSWSDQALVLMTVVLCDIALNDYLPRRIVLLAIQWLKDTYPPSWEPDLSELPDFYAGLSKALHLDQVEEERKKLYAELQKAVDNAAKGGTDADWHVSRMIQLYIQGQQARADKPHIFIEMLLQPKLGHYGDLSAFESLPLYQTSRGLYTVSTDKILVRSSMAFLALSHFAHYLANDKDDLQNIPECPFLKRATACDWDKTPNCAKQPWLREATVDQQGCVYRFAADALGVVDSAI